MISPDEFYRQVNNNFATIFKKMDDLHGETKEELEKIDDKVNKLKSAYDSHVAVGEALEKQEKVFKISRRAKIGIYLGIIPIALTLYALFS